MADAAFGTGSGGAEKRRIRIDAGVISVSVAMVLFTLALVRAYAEVGTGELVVYGDEYVTRYFDRNEVMQINIEIDPADWEYLMGNAMQEEFRPATVTVNGDVYPLAKIRPKGNSSLSSVAGSTSNRYSFKINFEQQTMAGLTQLNLNNCFSDPSYMREYLSYQVFEETGVPVPAFAYAAVYVNGKYFGLYLAVESILGPYLERHFGNITGDLYKSTGNNLAYRGSSPSDYTGLEVKSSLKAADWSKLIRMIEALNSGTDIEKYLDVDAALKYIAVCTALANFDSYQGQFAHNYYLYEQDGVFTILPWDLNMSFGGFGFGGDASTVYIDEPVQGQLSERPLVAKLLENPEYKEKYHGCLRQLATEFLSSGYLEAETSRLFDLIAEYVRTDPTAFYTYDQFVQSITGTIEGGIMEGADVQAGGQVAALPGQGGDAAGAALDRRGFRMGGVRGFGGNVPGLLEFAAEMSESIQKQLNGEIPSTNQGAGMGRGMGIGARRAPGDAGLRQPPVDFQPGRAGGVPPGEVPQPRERLGEAAPGMNMRPGSMRQGWVWILVSVAAMAAGIVAVLPFRRRRYSRL